MREGREFYRAVTTIHGGDPSLNQIVGASILVSWTSLSSGGHPINERALFVNLEGADAPDVSLETLGSRSLVGEQAAGQSSTLDVVIQLPARHGEHAPKDAIIARAVRRMRAYAGEHGLIVGVAAIPSEWADLTAMSGFVRAGPGRLALDAKLVYDLLTARLGPNQLVEADTGDLSLALGTAVEPSRIHLVRRRQGGGLGDDALPLLSDARVLAVTAFWQPTKSVDYRRLLKELRSTLVGDPEVIPLMPLDRRELLAAPADAVGVLFRIGSGPEKRAGSDDLAQLGTGAGTLA